MTGTQLCRQCCDCCSLARSRLSQCLLPGQGGGSATPATPESKPLGHPVPVPAGEPLRHPPGKAPGKCRPAECRRAAPRSTGMPIPCPSPGAKGIFLEPAHFMGASWGLGTALHCWMLSAGKGRCWSGWRRGGGGYASMSTPAFRVLWSVPYGWVSFQRLDPPTAIHLGVEHGAL